MKNDLKEFSSNKNGLTHENHNYVTQEQNKTKNLHYLEFYSGIGGWGYALEKACAQYYKKTNKNKRSVLRPIPKRLAAFDHSDLANIVLSHNDANNKTSTHDEPIKSLKHVQDARIKAKEENSNSQKRKRKSSSIYSNDSTCCTISIEKLTANQLIDMNAHIWLMSPPCQPYSRNNVTENRDMTDPRSKSFLHLCQLLKQMKAKSTKCFKDGESFLPFLICMENVVGFEKSDCCSIWRETLHECGYTVGHFHLSPVQVGIPNDRPRYYCLAFLNNKSKDYGSTSEDTKPSMTCAKKEIVSTERPIKCNDSIQKLSSYLIREASFSSSPIDSNLSQRTNSNIQNSLSSHDHISPPIIHTHIPELDVRKIIPEKSDLNQSEKDNINSNTSEIMSPPISMFLDLDLHPPKFSDTISSNFILNVQKLEALRVPPKLLKSDTAWCFDIVTPENSRSSCFTQAYGRFVRGTGSVLYMTNISRIMKYEEFESVGTNTKIQIDTCGSENTKDEKLIKFALIPPEKRCFNADWAKGLDLEQHLRYFSGNEVARLMGFPIIEENDRTQISSTWTKKTTELDTSEYVQNEINEANLAPQIFPCSRFSFPSHLTLKQQWKLLGNSLNVSVASKVAEIGLSLFLEAQGKSNEY